MTRVTYGYCGDRVYFEASGHAVYGEELSGCREEADTESALVCASVSILVLSAAERLSEMERKGDFLTSDISIEPGYACFDITPRHDSAETVNEIVGLLMTGVELLEENYPELVCCE